MADKWITIKGNHIPLKDGETPKQALERFKSDKLHDNDTPKMEKNNKLYDSDIPEIQKEKWLTKTKGHGIIILSKKEYAKFCHAIRTKYADEIPKSGHIFLDNHFCKFRYNKQTERLVCTLHIPIESNRKLINLYIGGENGKDNS